VQILVTMPILTRSPGERPGRSFGENSEPIVIQPDLRRMVASNERIEHEGREPDVRWLTAAPCALPVKD